MPNGVLTIFLDEDNVRDDVTIREAEPSDLQGLLTAERLAFSEEADIIAKFVSDLLVDPSARPILSLVAEVEGDIVGHILFTKAMLDGAGENLSISILAPLAIKPEFQKQGIGGALIEMGITQLNLSNVDLVFVLGHPDYYPRHGFEPALQHGFEASYPIPSNVADAWMVRELQPNSLTSCSGRVRCADAMDKPEYWRE